jgi:hypothetical protein
MLPVLNRKFKRGPAKGWRVRDNVPNSTSYAPAQFRIEFSSNRSDDICGRVLGETADEKHLVGQRQACRDILWKYRAGSSPHKRYDFLIVGDTHNRGYGWILHTCMVKNALDRMASIKR